MLDVCYGFANVALLTLGAHAQEGYCSCVCVSVKSHLTSGASVCPENTVTYLAGNGGRKICGDFSETAVAEIYCFLHCRVLQRHSAHFFDGRAFQGS